MGCSHAQIDETHDADLRSWVESANDGTPFPIQNLPLGIFDAGDGDRIGIAIGDRILDVAAVSERLASPRIATEILSARTLNPLFAAGADTRTALRRWASQILSDRQFHSRAEPFLRDAEACNLQLPAIIGDYSDFYVGIQHATNVGKMFRPDHPLLDNYKWLPVGYHGRASSVVVSGTPVCRPRGQLPPARPGETPVFDRSARLDYELELAVWVGEGNPAGQPISIEDAPLHIAGYGLLNDWSARDIQVWEYQPLGPFLAKSFTTSVSPWVITPEALAPFRNAPKARSAGDPALLAHLDDPVDQTIGSYAVTLEVSLSSREMRLKGQAPHRLSKGDLDAMYWTVAQIVTHHTSNGCNLRPGDLIGSGTLSGHTVDSLGSLLEISEGGKKPILLPSGERRSFLADGDEISLTAWACAPSRVSIGFGKCSGTIVDRLNGQK